MNTGAWILVASTVLYVLATAAFAIQRQYALAVVYFGYSIANFGVVAIAVYNRG